MSERKYMGSTLDDIEMGSQMDGVTLGLIDHIRELQAEVERLKTERREFGMRCVNSAKKKSQDLLWANGLNGAYNVLENNFDIFAPAIVEQELAK